MKLPARTTIETTVRIRTEPENEARYWDEEYLFHDRADAISVIGELVVSRCVDCKVPKITQPEFIEKQNRYIEASCSKELQDNGTFSPCFIMDASKEFIDISSSVLNDHIE